MKETKVYMSKLPKSCVGCKYFTEHRRQCNLELCLQWNEVKFKFDDCPLIDIKTHDKEILEEQREKTFILYSLLYQELEKQDSENVASRIDYLTGKDYSEMCELYKTAKNLKQHDRELVKEVCEKIRKTIASTVDLAESNQQIKDQFHIILDLVEKEFEK